MNTISTFQPGNINKIDNIKQIELTNNNQDKYIKYLIDESRLTPSSQVKRIFFPANEAEISTIVKYCQQTGNNITISGARTGIVGGGVAQSTIVISLEKMEKIIGLGFCNSRKNWFLKLEPQVSIAKINETVLKKNISDLKNLTPDSKDIFKTSPQNFFYPVDPTEMNASIGGTIATNASGARSFRYGATRNWIKKIRVILYTGEILEIEKGKYFANQQGEFEIKTANKTIKLRIPDYQVPEVKNAAGIYSKPNMDLIDLFIGSEGILGIISEIELWLTEYHPGIANILFFHEEKNAFLFVNKIKENPIIQLDFLEFIDKNGLELIRKQQKANSFHLNIPLIKTEYEAGVFFDFEYNEKNLEKNFKVINQIAMECNTSTANSWSAYEPGELERLKEFRHALPETVNSIISERKKHYPQLHKLGTDMSVPDENFSEIRLYYHQMLKQTKLQYVIFGHVGDNHLHINIMPENLEELKEGKNLYELFARKAVELKGTVSAEHGIGKMKKQYLKIMYGENGIAEMKRIKLTLDPEGLFNRNNMFDW